MGTLKAWLLFFHEVVSPSRWHEAIENVRAINEVTPRSGRADMYDAIWCMGTILFVLFTGIITWVLFVSDTIEWRGVGVAAAIIAAITLLRVQGPPEDRILDSIERYCRRRGPAKSQELMHPTDWLHLPPRAIEERFNGWREVLTYTRDLREGQRSNIRFFKWVNLALPLFGFLLALIAGYLDK